MSGSHGAFVSRHAYEQLCVCCAILAGFLLLSPVFCGQELQLAPLPLSSADTTLTSLMTPVAQSAPTASAEHRVTPQESVSSQLESQEKRSGTWNDRILGTTPNFLTVEDADKSPSLTPGQKFKVVARDFDSVEFVLVGFVAGLEHASNSNPSNGQGAEGYTKRCAASYSDNSTRNFTPSAVSLSLLHQDPRYYQLGHGGFLKRTGPAVGRVIITRSDSGHTQLSYSFDGRRSAAAISTYTYRPG